MELAKRTDIQDIALHYPGNGNPPNFMVNERSVALKSLKDHSKFQPTQSAQAPYVVDLSIQDNRLIFEMHDADKNALPALVLSLKPYRRLIKDYFMMIDSYEQMRSTGNTSKLEAIDMGRRGLHNEGAELMMERLRDKIDMDLETARGFFTLICVLQAGPHLR
ncbi:MAG: UPF0262 family protein [Pseudomonadota bacterium]